MEAPQRKEGLPRGDAISAETKIRICECNFTWIVHDVGVQFNEVLKSIRSPIFSPVDDDGIKFVAELQVRAKDKDDLIYKTDEDCLRSAGVGLKVHLVADERRHVVIVKWRYRIPAQAGKASLTGTNYKNETWDDDDGWTYVGSRSELLKNNDFLRDDNLTISLEVAGFGHPINFLNDVEIQRPSIIIPGCRMREKTGELLETGEFSDVTLVVDDTEIRAHKAILATGSTVFFAMFKSDMMEKKNNRVDVKDIKADVLMEMLRFIYVGETTKLYEMATDLLAAADEYALERLKCLCEAVLCRDITIERATDIFKVADLHRARHLKRMAMDFIVANFAKVKETADYKELVQEYPALMDELLTHCVTNMKVIQ